MVDKKSVEFLKKIVRDRRCVDKALKNGKDQELDDLIHDSIEIRKCIGRLIQDEFDNLVPDKVNQFILGQLIQRGVGDWVEGKIIYLGEEQMGVTNELGSFMIDWVNNFNHL